MKRRIGKIVQRWRQLPVSRRRWLALAGGGVASLAVVGLWYWLGQEAPRARRALAAAELRQTRVRDGIAELRRLEAEPARQRPTVAPAAVQAVLAVQGLDLAVRAEGVDRISLKGDADFDRWLAALATLQRDLGLRPTAMAVWRDAGRLRLEATLGPATP